MRSGRRLVCAASLFTAMLWFTPSNAPGQRPPVPKRILAVHWEDKTDAAEEFDRSLQKALRSATPAPVEYYSEFLDATRFPGEDQSNALATFLRRKYASRRVDIVVTDTPPPLEFLFRYRSDLFADIPIVFATTQRPSEAQLAAGAGATGITYSGYRKTLELALRLQPASEHVFIVSNSLPTGPSWERVARADLAGFQSSAKITYLTDLPLGKLTARLRTLPQHSIVLYIWQRGVNPQGVVLDTHELLSFIAPSVPVPIYGLSSANIGAGIVGGYVWTSETRAAKLAEMTLRIANGTRPADIPVEASPLVPMFDWRQLQRWGIHEDRLPHGSVIRFREFTVWQQYKWRIVVTIAVLVLQTVLICALLILRKRAQNRATALGEAQRVLQESEERFRRVFEEGPLGVALIGSDHGFLKVNGALCQMVGYSEAELTQMFFVDITHPEDVQADAELANRLFKLEIPSYRTQRRYVKKDGEVIWVNLTASLIRAQDGEPLYELAMVEDISDLKRAAEEALARQKLESIGTLASGIAHDFNNLLGGIIATSELLLNDSDSGVSDGLQIIKKVAERGAEIVRQLMIYSGQESPVFEEVDFAELLREMLQLLGVSIAKSAVLKVDIPATVPLIWANPAQLRQVVMNLIINASEAIKDREGSIWITLTHINPLDIRVKEHESNPRNGGWLRLEVRDSGCGMPEEVQSKIFDPFFSTKSAGRGLGLAAVRGMISTHGGTITVDSRLGEGSSFQVLLPCTSQTRPEELEIVRSSSPTLQGVIGTVLIIDDEESLRASTVRLLRAKEVKVLDASDGPTGIQVFRENANRIQAILLDLSLPGMSGLDILREIRKVSPKIPVIITTAYGREQVFADVSEENSVFYLQKPYGLGRLIKTLLSVSQANREQISIV